MAFRFFYDDILEGFPLVNIRKILRLGNKEFLTKEKISLRLKTTSLAAFKLIKLLESKSYITNIDLGSDLWATSVSGNLLAMSTLIKRIDRYAANEKINGFLERLKEVNENNYYLYKVQGAYIYGEYLNADILQLSKVQILIILNPKESDKNKHMELIIERAHNSAHVFSNSIQQYFYAEGEVPKFLKSRIHNLEIKMSDKIPLRFAVKQIFKLDESKP